MAGHGGHKHRINHLKQRRRQQRKKASANLVRVRKGFEDKGQSWDPKGNQAHAAALNHLARRRISASEYTHH
jgi:hypothetical protein